MSAARLARALGIVLIAAAAFDPACDWQRELPVPVEVRAASTHAGDERRAAQVRDQIARASARVVVDARSRPRAVVLAGAPHAIDDLPDAVPVSIVLPPESDRDTRLVDVTLPARVLAGQTATIHVEIEARGAQGSSSRLALERQGIELAAADHQWTGERARFQAAMTFAPTDAGRMPLRVVARPIDGETRLADNHLDFALLVEDRRLRVLFFEPRPSWTAAFVRRALESDPLFDVAALTRPAPGIDVRGGPAPARIALDALIPFDAVVVGAPEELRHAEVAALREFARTRGGAVVLVPDRRPSGPYTALVPARRFDEVLLESPGRASGTVASLRTTEVVVPVEPAPHADAIATLPHRGRDVPVVLACPDGEGWILFSGALDAWRFRDGTGDYARFWRAEIAQAALAAPPPVEIAITPESGASGSGVNVRARLRRSELRPDGRPPVLHAEVLAPDGTIRPLRLWPTAAFATFEGEAEPRSRGTHIVRVTTGDRVAAEQPFVVLEDGRTAAPEALSSARALADATGGTVVRQDEIDDLIRRLESIPSASERATIRPARSPWWMSAAVLLLAVEWTLRRRSARP